MMYLLAEWYIRIVEDKMMQLCSLSRRPFYMMNMIIGFVNGSGGRWWIDWLILSTLWISLWSSRLNTWLISNRISNSISSSSIIEILVVVDKLPIVIVNNMTEAMAIIIIRIPFTIEVIIFMTNLKKRVRDDPGDLCSRLW